jgi:DegV family protein with EDD domain
VNKIAIISESASNLPAELIERYHIQILPIWLTWGEKSLRDGIDITPEEVYTRIESGELQPTTSTFNPNELLTLLNSLAGEYQAAVAILLSKNLTRSVEIARSVAELPTPVPLHVIDSHTAAMAQGFVVLEAARAADSGSGIDRVLSIARSMIQRVHFLCVLETLKYLHRGGRVGIAPYYLGETLQLKPIIAIRPGSGEVTPIARPRTWHRALDHMVDMIEQIVGEHPLHAAVSHGNRQGEAEQVAAELNKRFDVRELYINHLTPVMGAHAGPLVGVAFYTETNDV